MVISARAPVPIVKYGYPCEWDRWICGRHFTFRLVTHISFNYVAFGAPLHKNVWVAVSVTKWDENDLWVEEERVFKLGKTDELGFRILLRRSKLSWILDFGD